MWVKRKEWEKLQKRLELLESAAFLVASPYSDLLYFSDMTRLYETRVPVSRLIAERFGKMRLECAPATQKVIFENEPKKTLR